MCYVSSELLRKGVVVIIVDSFCKTSSTKTVQLHEPVSSSCHLQLAVRKLHVIKQVINPGGSLAHWYIAGEVHTNLQDQPPGKVVTYY